MLQKYVPFQFPVLSLLSCYVQSFQTCSSSTCWCFIPTGIPRFCTLHSLCLQCLSVPCLSADIYSSFKLFQILLKNHLHKTFLITISPDFVLNSFSTWFTFKYLWEFLSSLLDCELLEVLKYVCLHLECKDLVYYLTHSRYWESFHSININGWMNSLICK